MLDSVVLTRGEVWMSPEVRKLVGVDVEDDQVGFAIMLDEAVEDIENTMDRHEMPVCA